MMLIYPKIKFLRTKKEKPVHSFINSHHFILIVQVRGGILNTMRTPGHSFIADTNHGGAAVHLRRSARPRKDLNVL